MNMSQAIFEAIHCKINVSFNGAQPFAILAPLTRVSREKDFYDGHAIVQIQGAQGQVLDFEKTIKAYRETGLTKGQTIVVEIHGTMIECVFHHFYTAIGDETRFIAHDMFGDEIHRAHRVITNIRG